MANEWYEALKVSGLLLARRVCGDRPIQGNVPISSHIYIDGTLSTFIITNTYMLQRASAFVVMTAKITNVWDSNAIIVSYNRP